MEAEDAVVVDGPRVEVRHRRLNSLFGIIPWKSRVTERLYDERSVAVKSILFSPDRPSTITQYVEPRVLSDHINLANLFWVAFFGWWVSLGRLVSSAWSFLLYMGLRKKRLLLFAERELRLARYFFFPFNKYVHLPRKQVMLSTRATDGEGEQHRAPATDDAATEVVALLAHDRSSPHHHVDYLFMIGAIVPAFLHAVAMVATWLFVLTIPASKADEETVLFVPSAGNHFYYKYSLRGVNIIVANLFAFVLASIILGFVMSKDWLAAHAGLIFFMCTVSIFPLAYCIGMSISSIAAQSTFGVGAVLNASFGSIIELILYYQLLREERGATVKSSLVGTVLGTMLLMPGLAMIFSGLRYKERRFNRAAAGVSAALLLAALVGIFLPTILFRTYGSYDMQCTHCTNLQQNVTADPNRSLECLQCTYEQPDPADDPFYRDKVQPLSVVCSVILPLTYLIGLWFTLRTHAKEIDAGASEADGDNGHDVLMSRSVGLSLLCGCTVLFTLISETLVTVLEPALKNIGLSEQTAGLTLLALVPNSAEFLNAVQFALQGNISLALEIGCAAAVQTSMIQTPAVVIISSFLDAHVARSVTFSLVFPSISMFAVVLSVISYITVSIDGKANYFQGAILVAMYILIVGTHSVAPALNP